MHVRLVATAAIAMFTASAADALTYAGSLTAGATTATFSIRTDGSFGVLSNANLVNVAATITSDDRTSSFTSPNLLEVNGATLVASATQLVFDTSVVGSFIVGNQTSIFAVICLNGAGLANSCIGGSIGEILLGAAFPQDFDITTNNARYVLATRVPEPATWSLLIGGFGLSGLAWRRRRAVDIAVARPRLPPSRLP